MTKFQKRLWLYLLCMAFLTPAGIILPLKFHSGGAWGEWSPEELERLTGFLPKGLKELAELWNAPVADYSFGNASSPLSQQITSYIVSGFIGICLAVLIIYLISSLTRKKNGT